MKKSILLLSALLCMGFSQAKTVYLNTLNGWEDGGCNKFAAWSWGSADGAWAGGTFMTNVASMVWSADIPDDHTHIVFCRFSPGLVAPNWPDAIGDDFWGKSCDEIVPADNDAPIYTPTMTWWDEQGCFGGGAWGTYSGDAGVTYHIVGEGFPGLSWDDHLPLGEGNTIAFSDLPAGTYMFKITNGTWAYNLGFGAVDAACSTAGYASGDNGNVVVRTASVGDITISVDNGRICLDVTGEIQEIGTSVPSECGDVLLQGFYWNSYSVDDEDYGTDIYGDTRWKSLLTEADEIGAYFDLIWLPPSALASGTGYYPRQYSNQNSDWGSRSDLERLIATFHNSGTRVIADVVLDHLIAMTGWCDFATMNFGKYGTFTPDLSWICKGDEINTNPEKRQEAGECGDKATGPDDEGDNNDGARDLAHAKSEVQAFSKAYLQWLLDEMHYDGFRWDEAKGFDPIHIGEYNAVANPYISFVERWSGNDDIIWTIERSGRRTMALDFQTRYAAFHDQGTDKGISKFNYSGCAGSGLLGAGYSKYSVTFVDNHDSFLRNDGEFGGKGNSMKPAYKDRLLQANAFMLAMPGVPCVFYPHWAKYKEDIKPMINARHLAGIHSESPVEQGSEYADHDGYQCTLVGKNGRLILQLGNRTTHTAWDPAYKLVASGNGYAMWVSNNHDVAPGIIATQSTAFEDAENGIDVTIQAVGGSGPATIYYTTDGSNPTTESNIYTEPLNFKQTTELRVMAVCGDAQSRVQVYSYTYREPLKRGIRVRFAKPDEWSKVYIFAWLPGVDEKGNATSENLLGAYPGQRIYQEAEGWYVYEFDPELKTVNFCINSGRDCGGINVRSNDLEINYDACYGWGEGKATEEKEEVLLNCDTDLHPDFDIAINPESGYFRDLEQGQEITLTAIGAENALIYYTTDGKTPTDASDFAPSPVTLKLTQSTTVKAYAMAGTEKTAIRSATYEYKAPQSGPIQIKFMKPEKWETLYLYAFTRVKVGGRNKDTHYSLDGGTGEWPGMPWTNKQGDWYVHTLPADIHELYIIFTEGMKKDQSQDIFIDENTCYVWNDDCKQALISPNCDGKTPVEEIEGEMPQPDFDRPMYNILGQPVGRTYRGIVLQDGVKYLLMH